MDLPQVIERWPCCDAAKRWSGFPPSAASIWHRPTCSTLVEYPFRDSSPVPTCDKCSSTDIVTKFHDGRWWEFQDHLRDPDISYLGRWSCLLKSGYRPTEHLDRTCRTCGFGWLEATADRRSERPA